MNIFAEISKARREDLNYIIVPEVPDDAKPKLEAHGYTISDIPVYGPVDSVQKLIQFTNNNQK